MTNAMIILWESVGLMEQGKISGTGKFVVAQNAKGEDVRVEIPEPIHTFQTWKQLGYSVKKGEHAIASFHIWKHTSKVVKDENGDEKDVGNMFMKKAHFFKRSQVEPLARKEVMA